MCDRSITRSSSAKLNGRHYAAECHFSGKLPDTCLIIDPEMTPCVDLMINVAATGLHIDCQTVVMIRNVIDDDDGELGSRFAVQLDHITRHNTTVRLAIGGSTGTARASKGDVGAMYSIGTRVELDGLRISPYHTNSCVPERILRDLVVAFPSLRNISFQRNCQ